MKKTSILLAAVLLVGILHKMVLAEPSAGAATITAAPVAHPRWETIARKNTSAAHARAKEIALIFDGDSITDWWLRDGQQTWNERYAKLGAADFGIAGDRTQNVLWRLGQGQVDGLHPKLVAIMIGTNNMGTDSVEDIAAGVAAIVAEYRKRCPDAVILLQGIFPRGQKADNPVRAKIRAVNEHLARLADEKKVIYRDFGNKFLDADGSISREIMPDYLHLSPKGYEIWAEAIQPVIDQHVGKPLDAAGK